MVASIKRLTEKGPIPMYEANILNEMKVKMGTFQVLPGDLDQRPWVCLQFTQFNHDCVIFRPLLNLHCCI